MGFQRELTCETPRLLDSVAKAKWFDGIWIQVVNNKLDAKIAIASIKHAESVGYILPSDMTEFISKLYPFMNENKIKAGFIIATENESTIDQIWKMIGCALRIEPVKAISKHEEFKKLLLDPPDGLTSGMLQWDVQVWLDSLLSSNQSYDGLEVGWRDGNLMIDYSFEEDEV